jgi:hypothetical protein
MDIIKLFSKYEDEFSDFYSKQKELLFSEQGLTISIPNIDIRKVSIERKKGMPHYIQIYFNRSLPTIYRKLDLKNSVFALREKYDKIFIAEDEKLDLSINGIKLEELRVMIYNREIRLVASMNNKDEQEKIKFNKIQSINKEIVLGAGIDLNIKIVGKESSERKNIENLSYFNHGNDYLIKFLKESLKPALKIVLDNYRQVTKDLTEKTISEWRKKDYLRTQNASARKLKKYLGTPDSTTWTPELIDSMSINNLMQNRKEKEVVGFVIDCAKELPIEGRRYYKIMNASSKKTYNSLKKMIDEQHKTISDKK